MTPSEPYGIDAPAGVTALERRFRSKANRATVTQRLYRKDGSPLSVAVMRGGPLHVADEHTWQLTMMYNGIAYGELEGFVTEERLASIVRALAAWGKDAA